MRKDSQNDRMSTHRFFTDVHLARLSVSDNETCPGIGKPLSPLYATFTHWYRPLVLECYGHCPQVQYIMLLHGPKRWQVRRHRHVLYTAPPSPRCRRLYSLRVAVIASSPWNSPIRGMAEIRARHDIMISLAIVHHLQRSGSAVDGIRVAIRPSCSNHSRKSSLGIGGKRTFDAVGKPAKILDGGLAVTLIKSLINRVSRRELLERVNISPIVLYWKVVGGLN
jgi:hypothetical protein